MRLDDNVVESDQRPTAQDSAISTPATADTIIQALERGTDLNQTLDATAGGVTGGTGVDGGSTFVQLLRITEGVDPLAFQYSFQAPATTDTTVSPGATPAEAIAASIAINPILGDNVINAAEAAKLVTTITGTVGADVKVGDTVTLTTNGTTYTTTVTQGESGLVFSVAVNTADLLADPSIDVSVTASNATGSITATATDAIVLTVDTQAVATITINPIGDDIINASEASQHNTTITGTVGGDAKVGDTVTLKVNGHEVTGLVTGTPGNLVYSIAVVTADLVADKNVHATVSVTDPAGNTATASQDHAVTLETTTVTVNQVDAEGSLVVGNVVEGNAITFRFSVDHAPVNELKLNVTVGGVEQTVTIASGTLHGDLTVASRPDDNYVQGTTSVVATVTGVDPVANGGFPSLSFNGVSLSTNVVDNSNTTTVTLHDVTALENETFVYTASLDHPTQGAFAVTLSNGVVINFADGATTGSSAVQAAQGDDVYADGSVTPVSIASTAGGNFEDLNTESTATVTINDTITPMTVNLSASTDVKDCDNAAYTFTATLSAASHGETTIVTDKGTIIIDDGKTTGTLVVAGEHDEHADSSLTVTIQSATGGNFESLVIGTGISATATILHDDNYSNNSHDNNGWGNGDQDAPGHSLGNNNAENSQNLKGSDKYSNDMHGGLKNDDIAGGLHNDHLQGGDGNDMLRGGGGDDRLTGDAGDNTFVWKLADLGTADQKASDVVTDFSKGDKLDINDLLTGNDKHQVSAEILGNDTHIHIKDMSGHEVQEITLQGYHNADDVKNLMASLIKSSGGGDS